MSISERYDLIVTPRAMQGIRKILHYIVDELKNPTAAINLNSAIEQEIQSLEYNPQRKNC